MMNNPQQQIEVQDAQEPSKEGALVAEIFSEIRKKQVDFIDESGKGIIERITTFLTVLFAVTAFSNNFPPPYLKANLLAKILVIITLVMYLLAMAVAILAIQPRYYDVPLYNVTRMGKELKTILSYKMLRLRIAGVLFALGSIALAALIISIIWSI